METKMNQIQRWLSGSNEIARSLVGDLHLIKDIVGILDHVCEKLSNNRKVYVLSDEHCENVAKFFQSKLNTIRNGAVFQFLNEKEAWGIEEDAVILILTINGSYAEKWSELPERHTFVLSDMFNEAYQKWNFVHIQSKYPKEDVYRLLTQLFYTQIHEEIR